ncbi:hypothetical protein H4219_001896 [Mycoemilia scoparia]|uniref:Ndc10 domain-containing protein n=1 Tax=Mycoemilia scoparia TaxID=417184 RepID=A0A9W8DRA2_9FUNG|nr:hypothetical protein H4219_001896 [Mycoemilia scoparia]
MEGSSQGHKVPCIVVPYFDVKSINLQGCLQENEVEISNYVSSKDAKFSFLDKMEAFYVQEFRKFILKEFNCSEANGDIFNLVNDDTISRFLESFRNSGQCKKGARNENTYTETTNGETGSHDKTIDYRKLLNCYKVLKLWWLERSYIEGRFVEIPFESAAAAAGAAAVEAIQNRISIPSNKQLLKGKQTETIDTDKEGKSIIRSNFFYPFGQLTLSVIKQAERYVQEEEKEKERAKVKALFAKKQTKNNTRRVVLDSYTDDEEEDSEDEYLDNNLSHDSDQNDYVENSPIKENVIKRMSNLFDKKQLKELALLAFEGHSFSQDRIRSVINFALSTAIPLNDVSGITLGKVRYAGASKFSASKIAGAGPRKSFKDCKKMLFVNESVYTPEVDSPYILPILRHQSPLLCPWNALAVLLFHKYHILEHSPPLYSSLDWGQCLLFSGTLYESGNRERAYDILGESRSQILKLQRRLGYKVSFTDDTIRNTILKMLHNSGFKKDEIIQLDRWRKDLELENRKKAKSLDFKLFNCITRIGVKNLDNTRLLGKRFDVEPPQELLKEIFPWIESELSWIKEFGPVIGKKVKSYSSGRECPAFRGHIELLDELRKTLLQDAAILLHSEETRYICKNHPVFGHGLFRSPEFKAFQHRVLYGKTNIPQVDKPVVEATEQVLMTSTSIIPASTFMSNAEHIRKKIETIEAFTKKLRQFTPSKSIFRKRPIVAREGSTLNPNSAQTSKDSKIRSKYQSILKRSTDDNSVDKKKKSRRLMFDLPEKSHRIEYNPENPIILHSDGDDSNSNHQSQAENDDWGWGDEPVNDDLSAFNDPWGDDTDQPTGGNADTSGWTEDLGPGMNHNIAKDPLDDVEPGLKRQSTFSELPAPNSFNRANVSNVDNGWGEPTAHSKIIQESNTSGWNQGQQNTDISTYRSPSTNKSPISRPVSANPIAESGEEAWKRRRALTQDLDTDNCDAGWGMTEPKEHNKVKSPEVNPNKVPVAANPMAESGEEAWKRRMALTESLSNNTNDFGRGNVQPDIKVKEKRSDKPLIAAVNPMAESGEEAWKRRMALTESLSNNTNDNFGWGNVHSEDTKGTHPSKPHSIPAKPMANSGEEAWKQRKGTGEGFNISSNDAGQHQGRQKKKKKKNSDQFNSNKMPISPRPMSDTGEVSWKQGQARSKSPGNKTEDFGWGMVEPKKHNKVKSPKVNPNIIPVAANPMAESGEEAWKRRMALTESLSNNANDFGRGNIQQEIKVKEKRSDKPLIAAVNPMAESGEEAWKRRMALTESLSNNTNDFGWGDVQPDIKVKEKRSDKPLIAAVNPMAESGEEAWKRRMALTESLSNNTNDNFGWGNVHSEDAKGTHPSKPHSIPAKPMANSGEEAWKQRKGIGEGFNISSNDAGQHQGRQKKKKKKNSDQFNSNKMPISPRPMSDTGEVSWKQGQARSKSPGNKTEDFGWGMVEPKKHNKVKSPKVNPNIIPVAANPMAESGEEAWKRRMALTESLSNNANDFGRGNVQPDIKVKEKRSDKPLIAAVNPMAESGEEAWRRRMALTESLDTNTNDNNNFGLGHIEPKRDTPPKQALLSKGVWRNKLPFNQPSEAKNCPRPAWDQGKTDIMAKDCASKGNHSHSLEAGEISESGSDSYENLDWRKRKSFNKSFSANLVAKTSTNPRNNVADDDWV